MLNLNWRDRDKSWFDFYERHPHTVPQAVRAGYFPSYKIASRRLGRMKKRKRGRTPRIVGTVALHDTGRAAQVYCAWKVNSLLHEVMLTEELIKLPIPLNLWLRGGKTDRRLRPDAELPKLFVEFDMGTERKQQMQKQVKAYHQSQRTVLWIVPSVRQIDWITEVANKATTLVMLHGSSEVFDLYGQSKPVDKVCGKYV